MCDVPALRFPEFNGEWITRPIKDIADFIGGGTPSSANEAYWQGTIPWVSSSDIVEDNINDITISRYITEEAISNSATKLCSAPVILIVSRVGVGKVALSSKAICTSQDFCNLINIKVHPTFLAYSLSQIMKRKSIEVQGTSIKGITSLEIQKIILHIPSLQEQHKISDLFQLIDKRIAVQSKIIEDLRLLRDAISVCLLSPKSDWKCYKVSEIADIGRGRVISSKEIANQNNPQYPVYSSQTSNEGVMGYLDNYAFDGEYITWTTDGANAGTVFYRNGRFNCTNVCGTLKLHYQFDPYYCSLVLANATKKYVSVNLANPKLMNNTMAAIKLYLPPFQEQKRMAQLFRKMDENITLEHKLLLSYQKQKHYLLQQMFI